MAGSERVWAHGAMEDALLRALYLWAPEPRGATTGPASHSKATQAGLELQLCREFLQGPSPPVMNATAWEPVGFLGVPGSPMNYGGGRGETWHGTSFQQPLLGSITGTTAMGTSRLSAAGPPFWDCLGCHRALLSSASLQPRSTSPGGVQGPEAWPHGSLACPGCTGSAYLSAHLSGTRARLRPHASCPKRS